MKVYKDSTVLEEAQKRIEFTFDNFKKIYVSFSGGKDSGVMLHLVMEEAKKRNKKIGVLFIDLEGQYKLTIEYIENMFKKYEEFIDIYWVCLPLMLRNAVSVYEPRWSCWEDEKSNDWIRSLPKKAIHDNQYFPFFKKGMEFEEFVIEFGKWYGKGENTACFVGIRADESLNRYRTIANKNKGTFKGIQWTTKIDDNLFNIYPIYDWSTEDIWVYNGKYSKEYNKLYDYMHKAGLTISQQRICQPYGDDQRKGLWLFQIIEPETWGKVVARVNGANSGALYAQETGNILGVGKITKPPHLSWQEFANLLLDTLPESLAEHYQRKISIFLNWWAVKGYGRGIPDCVDPKIEASKKAPSWRRVCKVLLRNDYWCKGLSFSQSLSQNREKYKKLHSKKMKHFEYIARMFLLSTGGKGQCNLKILKINY